MNGKFRGNGRTPRLALNLNSAHSRVENHSGNRVQRLRKFFESVPRPTLSKCHGSAVRIIRRGVTRDDVRELRVVDQDFEIRVHCHRSLHVPSIYTCYTRPFDRDCSRYRNSAGRKKSTIHMTMSKCLELRGWCLDADSIAFLWYLGIIKIEINWN